MKRLLIIGAGGHGKVIAGIALACGYDTVAFLDDNTQLKTCMGYPVIGKTEDVFLYQKEDVFVAIGNPSVRQKIQDKLEEKGISVPVLIHPNAVTADNASIGKGTVIMAGAVVNQDARIGRGCIINTCASVDHDNRIGDFVHIAVGSHTAGTVTIGERTWLGIGAVISNDISVCADCMIGAGAAVVKDIKEAGTYIGVPAKKVKP